MDCPLALSSQLGAHLKSLRKLRGLSQAQLGKLVGVGQVRIADIEANPGLVNFDQILRVCRELGAEVILRADTTKLATPNLAGRARAGACAGGPPDHDTRPLELGWPSALDRPPSKGSW